MEQTHVRVNADTLELVRASAAEVGLSAPQWLSQAVRGAAETQRALRAQEARQGREVFTRFEEIDR